MARIRSIHPGLLTDEAFMVLTVECPLAIPLYLGVLMECDDEGVFEWKPLTLKAKVLPAVAADVSVLLDVLVANRFVISFEYEGRKFGAVRNFTKFQRPKKPHVTYRKTDEVRKWVGLSAPELPTGSEPDGSSSGQSSPPSGQSNGHSSPPVPHRSPTSGEKSPQMEEGGGNRKVDNPLPPALRPAAEPGGQAGLSDDFLKKLKLAAGSEPCRGDADFGPIEALLSEGCTEADVLSGIAAALEKTHDRIRHWTAFAGWVRNARDDRMAGPRKGPQTAAQNGPSGPKIPLKHGLMIPRSEIIRTIRDRRPWPVMSWGAAPGEPGCLVPQDVLREAAA